MDKILLYVTGAVIVVVAFFVLSEDTQQPQMQTVQYEQKEALKDDKPSDSVSITYEKEVKKRPTPQVKKEAKVDQSENFTLDNIEFISETTTESFGIYLISDYELTQPSNMFPQIPAVLKGTINGEAFSLMIPIGIENNDLRIRIKSFANENIKEYKKILTGLSSGSVNNVTFDFNNLQSATITSKIQSGGENSFTPPPLPGSY